MPDAGERAVFAARKSAGDRLAAGLRRDDVLGAAGDEHPLAIAARVFGEPALREAMHRLAIALRWDAPLAPAHELERDRRRAGGDEGRRAFLRHALRAQVLQ